MLLCELRMGKRKHNNDKERVAKKLKDDNDAKDNETLLDPTSQEPKETVDNVVASSASSPHSIYGNVIILIFHSVHL